MLAFYGHTPQKADARLIEEQSEGDSVIQLRFSWYMDSNEMMCVAIITMWLVFSRANIWRRSPVKGFAGGMKTVCCRNFILQHTVGERI